MHVEVISTDELGDRSYVVHDGSRAIVVDPQRDLDRIDAVLSAARLSVALVVETHVHNDYVTGGYALAERTGADYVVHADDPVGFARRSVADGDELRAGTLRVRAVHTPGHTDTHLAYIVTDTAQPDEPPAVFTGGSLLYGSVGRTDLVAAARTVELTHAQYRSARRLAELLPDDAAIYPTHGFGSFCSSGSSAGGEASTIGAEKARNDALTIDDEAKFVDTLVANLTAYPAYYAHMAPLNRSGPSAADLADPPTPVEPAELARRIHVGEWVVDLRDRTAYAADHLAGTISIELGNDFATYVGWLAPWGAPLTLIGESAEHVADAQRQLARIGIDELAGAATGTVDDLARPGLELDRRSFPRTDFAAARTAIGAGDIVLDVRRADEHRTGHVAGAVNIPIHDLLDRLDAVPPGRVWVHCASGYRAGIAASLLDRAGRDVVVIDDGYDNAGAAGWALTGGE